MRRGGCSLLRTSIILLFSINTCPLPCACSHVSVRSQPFVSCHGEIKKVLLGQQPLRISGGSHDRQAMSKFSCLPSVTTWLGILRRNEEQDDGKREQQGDDVVRSAMATPITFEDLRVKVDSLSEAGYTPAHKASCSGDWRDTLFVWQVMSQHGVSPPPPPALPLFSLHLPSSSSRTMMASSQLYIC